jgi:hypothetical protein
MLGLARKHFLGGGGEHVIQTFEWLVLISPIGFNFQVWTQSAVRFRIVT